MNEFEEFEKWYLGRDCPAGHLSKIIDSGKYGQYYYTAINLMFTTWKDNRQLKAGFEDMKNRNAVLRQRPDLPADRIPSIGKMDEQREEVLELKKKLGGINIWLPTLLAWVSVKSDEEQSSLPTSAVMLDHMVSNPHHMLREHDAKLLERMAKELSDNADNAKDNGFDWEGMQDAAEWLIDEASRIKTGDK